MRRMLTVGLSILILGVVAPILSVSLLTSSEPAKVQGVPVLDERDIRNPDIARQYGIRGYVELSWDDSSPQLAIHRGKEWSRTMLARFVSYDPKLTELEMRIDPSNRLGGQLGRLCQCEDGSLEDLSINEMISYSLSGTVPLKAGETLPIGVTLRIPEDIPTSITWLPIGAVGVWWDTPSVPCIDSTNERVVISND